jgi:triacylglycerol lipase
MPAVLGALIGWLLTAVALSLGAPFWYDILQKVVRLRSSMKPGGDAADKDGTAGQPGMMTTQGVIVAAEPFDEENFDLFKPNANSYNLVNAFWMTRFAELAYQDEKISQARCKEWGLTAHCYSVTDEKVDTQYFIAYNNDTVILSFRGTEPDQMADIETDADFQLAPCTWDEELQVHTDFQRALDAAWAPLSKQLGKLCKNRVLWITGHSLGGALAALAAHRLDYEEEYEGKFPGLKIGGLYTCGQPRCGNYDFAQDLGERLGNRICRIVNNRDIVPLVPPPVGYSHAGSTLYINETGRLMFDPPFWYRVLDKMEVATDKEKLAKSLKESVGDHSAGLYLSLLAKKL